MACEFVIPLIIRRLKDCVTELKIRFEQVIFLYKGK